MGMRVIVDPDVRQSMPRTSTRDPMAAQASSRGATAERISVRMTGEVARRARHAVPPEAA